jgi:hypothetical protein
MYLVSVYQTNRTFVWSFSIGSKLNLVLILSGDMESMLGDVEISLLALKYTSAHIFMFFPLDIRNTKY